MQNKIRTMNDYSKEDIIYIRKGKGDHNSYVVSLPQCKLTLNKELSFEYNEDRLLIREVEIDDRFNTRMVKDEHPRRSIEFTLRGLDDLIGIGRYPIDLDESNPYEIVVYCTEQDRIIN